MISDRLPANPCHAVPCREIGALPPALPQATPDRQPVVTERTANPASQPSKLDVDGSSPFSVRRKSSVPDEPPKLAALIAHSNTTRPSTRLAAVLKARQHILTCFCQQMFLEHGSCDHVVFSTHGLNRVGIAQTTQSAPSRFLAEGCANAAGHEKHHDRAHFVRVYRVVLWASGARDRSGSRGVFAGRDQSPRATHLDTPTGSGNVHRRGASRARIQRQRGWLVLPVGPVPGEQHSVRDADWPRPGHAMHVRERRPAGDHPRGHAGCGRDRQLLGVLRGPARELVGDGREWDARTVRVPADAGVRRGFERQRVRVRPGGGQGLLQRAPARQVADGANGRSHSDSFQ